MAGTDYFKIDTHEFKKPTFDGEVNIYINPEAAAAKRYFSSNKKVVFINGMNNSGEDHVQSALALSLCQMSPVVGVFNRSSGVIKDLWQCLGDKNQFQGLSKTAQGTVDSRNSLWQLIVSGKRSPATTMREALSRNSAQVSLFDLLRQPLYKSCEIFAHSQGNLILSNVLQGIAAVDGPEALKGYVVQTYGSPAVHYPPGVRVHEHGYTFDPVNWLSGFDSSFSISKVGLPTGSSNPITHGFLWYLRDDPRFVINRFRTGGWGMTFNMDETGLANNLFSMGTNMTRVYSIFKYLEENHNSDSDDVAVAYVALVKNDSKVSVALRAHKELVNLLIKAMDEGYTSRSEQDAIDWLRKSK